MILRAPETIRDQYNRPLAGAQVYVYNQDGSLATLTIDGTTPLTQPVNTDGFGSYSYWANTGFYTEETWFGGKKLWVEANLAVGTPAAIFSDFNVAHRAELVAIAGATNGDARILAEMGREGTFVFSTAAGDATLAALDTYQGIYVAGSGGTWVRRFAGAVHAAWFGLADGATTNAARLKSIETIFSPYAQHIVLPATPTGKLDFDAGVSFSLPHAIEGQGQGTDSKTATALRFPYGCGHGFAFRSGGLSDPGAQRASLRNLRIDLFGSPLAGGTANYSTGTPNSLTSVSPTANFATGRFVALEGAGKSLTVQDLTVAMTSGGNTATVADPLGTSSNPGVYVGQPVTVAGAGAAGADLVGFVGTWGSTSFTVVNAAGSALNAGTTVTAAAYTIKFPLFAEITAGGGTATLTTTTPFNAQNVTAGALRSMDCCVLASCTIDMANVELNGQGSAGILTAGGNCGLFLYGIAGEGTSADSSQFWNVKTGGNLGFAGVIAYGSDANAMSFHGCNFAGPKISVLDNSFLGNSYFGCHWAFNVGIVVAVANAQSNIFGGYMEAGTSYLAQPSSLCSFFATNSMINASGWQGVDMRSGSFTLPGFISGRHTCSEDVLVGRSLKGCSGTGIARFVGTGSSYPVGSTSITGISLMQNSGTDRGVIVAEDGIIYKGMDIIAADIAMRPANVLTATWSSSLGGLNMVTGKAFFLNGSVWLDGTIQGNSTGLGYATGAGGAVTQATSRTTGVTLNKLCGAITLFSAAGTPTWQSFTVTNSTVAATDVIRVVQKSGTDLNQIHVTNVAAGSFKISFATTGGTTTEQPVFNFAVIKAVAA